MDVASLCEAFERLERTRLPNLIVVGAITRWSVLCWEKSIFVEVHALKLGSSIQFPTESI